MTERSRPWDGSTTGDAVEAPYDAATEWARMFRALLPAVEQSTHKGGVVFGATGFSDMAPTSPSANTARIANGIAWNQGTWYESDANVDFTIPTPATSSRIDRIVLRKSWANQTIRLTRIAGTEGAGAPTMVQTFGTTWDVPIAQFSITTGGAITVIDDRVNLALSSVATVFYRGVSPQTLPSVGTTIGQWRYFKAYGGSLLITGPTNSIIPPGGTAVATTYTMPNGESTDWFNDGTLWVCQ